MVKMMTVVVMKMKSSKLRLLKLFSYSFYMLIFCVKLCTCLNKTIQNTFYNAYFNLTRDAVTDDSNSLENIIVIN